MGQDLGDGTLQAQGGGGRDRQHQQAHVAQGAVGHQAADVVLGDGVEGPVDGTDGTGGGDPGGPGTPGVGQEAHPEAQQAVGAQLGDHPTEHHHHRGGRLAVGEGLPAVQGNDGQLEAEAHQQQNQDPALRRHREGDLRQGGVAEIPMLGAEPAEAQHGRQQGEPGDRAVEQEAHGGGGTALTPPDGHQQRGGNQNELEEEDEQQGVAGQEGAAHSDVGGQQQGMEEPRAALIGAGRQDRERGQQGGEQQQRQRQAVEGEIQPQSQLRQPVESQIRWRQPPAEESEQELQACGQGGQGTHGGGALRWQQLDQQGSEQGQNQEQQKSDRWHQRIEERSRRGSGIRLAFGWAGSY